MEFWFVDRLFESEVVLAQTNAAQQQRDLAQVLFPAQWPTFGPMLIFYAVCRQFVNVSTIAYLESVYVLPHHSGLQSSTITTTTTTTTTTKEFIV
jgi:hypothetical protein